MRQNRESGADAAKFGHETAALIGEKLGAKKLSARSNEFELNGRPVTIRTARQRWLRATDAMHEELKKEIRRIAADCAAPGWDGCGASPVMPEAVIQALLFAEAIPGDLPTPTVGVESDGAFTFEWYHNPRLLLSVSVDASDALPYAAALASERISGTETFHGRMPRKLAALIRRMHEISGQSILAGDGKM